MTLNERYDAVLAWFEAEMPLAESELHFASPFELLAAVMLSAQCTDKRVNMVTPALFEAFPDAASMARAEVSDIFPYIKSVSYPNSKAAHLSAMSRELVARFGGEVPDSLEDLVSLPGVGRKTANVVLAVAFGRAAMPVDTHVFRVSHRLGLVSPTDDTPAKVEAALVSHIPAEKLSKAHHYLLLHGRYVCVSRVPKCSSCGLRPQCEHFGTLDKGLGVRG